MTTEGSVTAARFRLTRTRWWRTPASPWPGCGRGRGGRAGILVLGHSLGTAIASRALANTEAEAAPISGLVLMAAFNNFTDELVALQGRHVGDV